MQMRLTWVSGDMEPQQVQYGDGNTLPSQVNTFTQDQMCCEFLNIPFFFLYEHHIRRMRPVTYGSHHSYIYSYPFPSSYLLLRFFLYFLKLTASSTVPSPAKDFGWHDPGYIHSAVMTGLEPSSTFSYKYGRLFTTSVTYIC
jgi:hypothetical protein